MANRSAPGSGVTAPYGTIDDAGTVALSQETMRRKGADTATRPTKTTSKVPDSKIKKMLIKKVSRVFDVQKKNQVKNNFTGVPDTGMRACFNRSTCSPAVNMQQPPLATSHFFWATVWWEFYRT